MVGQLLTKKLSLQNAASFAVPKVGDDVASSERPLFPPSARDRPFGLQTWKYPSWSKIDDEAHRFRVVVLLQIPWI